jgi:hypothetical protein
MVSFWIKSPFSAQPDAYRGKIKNCSKTEQIDAIIVVGWIERGRAGKGKLKFTCGWALTSCADAFLCQGSLKLLDAPLRVVIFTHISAHIYA